MSADSYLRRPGGPGRIMKFTGKLPMQGAVCQQKLGTSHLVNGAGVTTWSYLALRSPGSGPHDRLFDHYGKSHNLLDLHTVKITYFREE
jgi:hypothetical protein